MLGDHPDNSDVWPDGTEAECGRCGKRVLCQWLSDPFVGEVYGVEEPPQWWCRPCHRARAEDV